MPTTYYSRQHAASASCSRRCRRTRRGAWASWASAPARLAAYAEPGDAYRFYDIDPAGHRVCRAITSPISPTPASAAPSVTIVEGDARLALEREPPQKFDVLVLDAFSGDAIPVHLLTLEAFEVYLRHVREPDGVLAVHVSNRHLDLPPVVQTAADRFGLEAWLVVSKPDTAVGRRLRQMGADDPRPVGRQTRLAARRVPLTAAAASTVWTDDYSSIWSVLRGK